MTLFQLDLNTVKAKPENTGLILYELLEHAASYSESGPGVTRRFLTKEHKDLLTGFKELADRLSFEFHIDDSGNACFFRKGIKPECPTFIMGSHQDTVIQGGKYDGIMGVLLPLIAASTLEALPFNILVVGFGDEEGTRFNSTLTGSSAIAGTFDFTMLKRKDEDGISMAEAMTSFGLNPQNIPSLSLADKPLLGFMEVHIEQGPVLESKGLPAGVVTAITGIERHELIVNGRRGHAGTVPMNMRDDALEKAAKIVTFVNNLCRETNELVGVVGKLNVSPNAVNVIPGEVRMTVELRSPKDAVRLNARETLHQYFSTIPGLKHECLYEQQSVKCDDDLSNLLSQALQQSGITPYSLFSGAGHDGLAMSQLTPCAMLFVRCKNGLSHHPDESVLVEDCQTAIDVVRAFLALLGEKYD